MIPVLECIERNEGKEKEYERLTFSAETTFKKQSINYLYLGIKIKEQLGPGREGV